MQKNIQLFLPLLIALLFFNIQTISAKEEIPKELAKFAKSPWLVESYAYGDLSGKKTKDAVIILALNPKGGDADDRKLVIATRQPSGDLQKEIEVRKAVPLAAGAVGAEPTVEIKNNSISLSQFGGSRERGENTYKYKKVSGKWRLIGFTSDWVDTIVESLPDARTDVNFLTGQVETSLRQNDKLVKQQNFYEIYSVAGKPSSQFNWKAPNLVLHAAQAKKLKGLPLISVQSMHDNQKLYLLVTVQNNNSKNEYKVSLVDHNLSPIKPSYKTDCSSPYKEYLEFSLAEPALKKELKDKEITKIDSIFLPFTILVTCQNKDSNNEIYSTAISAHGDKKHGGILLLPAANSMDLANIDVRDGTIQPTIINLPETSY